MTTIAGSWMKAADAPLAATTTLVDPQAETLRLFEEHGTALAWQRDVLAQIVGRQWLLASATSEETIGGNMRTSACAVEVEGERFRIEKLAPTISYGAHADGILVTARRTAESPASDQVLIVALNEGIALEKRGSWDSMGMRGTCSEGFRLVASGVTAQILPTPFAWS